MTLGAGLLVELLVYHSEKSKKSSDLNKLQRLERVFGETRKNARFGYSKRHLAYRTAFLHNQLQ